MNKKSQFTSVDFIFAVIVFSIILIALFYNWKTMADRVNHEKVVEDMSKILDISSRSLIDSYGNPINWNNLSDLNLSSVNSIGLKLKTGEVSTDKLDYLISLNSTKYETIKKILGVQGPNYEFYFEIYIFNGTEYNINKTFGILNKSSEKILSVQRNFILNNSWAKGRFYISK